MDLSVIIPCHNAAPYIGQAVASVLDQAGLPAGFELEIVIADDRSDDGATPAVLAELARRHPQVRVVANDGARGPGPVRNFAVRHARGRWLAFLDADDWWLPGALGRCLGLIAANPDAQWVAGGYRIVYDPGTQQPGRVVDIAFAEDAVLAQARPVPGGLRWVQPVGIPVNELAFSTCSTWIRRELFAALGGFDERLWNAEDLHLWLRLSAVTDLFHVPEMLSVYRRRAGSETNSGRPQNYWDIRCHADLYGDPRFRSVRGKFAVRIAQGCVEDSWRYRRGGQFRAAALTALQGLRYAPTDGRLWRSLLAAVARRP